MAREDVELTFDPNPFTNGIKSITKGFSNMVNSATGAVNSVLAKIPVIGKMFRKNSEEVQKAAKGTSKGIMDAFGKLAVIGTGFMAGFAAIKGALSAIPEIGMTFKAVGNIIGKNLLWPLRQELIPILQKVLDWARENRAMFVKWGGVLVNVFKAVKVAFGAVFNLVKRLTSTLMDSLKGLIKFAGKDVTELVNIIIFKLVAIFTILEAKLSPIFEFIGKGLGEISVIFADFFKELENIGVLDAFFQILSDLGTLISKVLVVAFELFKASLKGLTSLLSGFFEGLGEVEGLNDSWKSFLEIIGSVLDLTNQLIQAISKYLNPLLKSMGSIVGKLVGGALKGLFEILGGIGETLGKLITLSIEKLGGDQTIEAPNTRRVNDAIIRPNGQIIETNPNDTLFAVKNAEGRGIIPTSNVSNTNNANNNFAKTINVKMEGININVTEGNARQAGVNFGAGLETQLRQILLDERSRVGDR